jgi:hypothetical protein
VSAARELVGRTGDLSHAYKQIAVLPEHRRFAIVAVVEKETGETRYFVSWTLLFGESAAVYAFNRVARALQRVCTSLGDLVLVNYFDDYPQLEVARLAESTRATFKGVFSLLGWELAGDSKDCDFAKEFVVLGVQVVLADAPSGQIVVANKASRVAEVCSVIKGMIERAGATPAEVSTVVGRVHHLESVHFGRCAAAALRTLRRFGGGKGGRAVLNEEELSALAWLAAMLPIARPRVVRAFGTTRPVLVFTDGACEGEGASCGAVLLDGEGVVEFFGLPVPDVTYRGWRQGASSQVIGQAELWPVLLSLTTWADRLAGRRVIFFIDQDAARQALVKAYSPSRPSAGIIAAAIVKVAELEVYPWFARVPTACNVADAASRLDFAQVLRAVPGAVQRKAVIPE